MYYLCPPYWIRHSTPYHEITKSHCACAPFLHGVPRNTTFEYCSCLYNGKFKVTTFKSHFSRCLNCLESFRRAESTPKMADFGLRGEKGLGLRY